MRFGLHFGVACGPHQSAVQRYHETIEQAVLGEAMGYESVWPVEQHFAAEISNLPAPLLLLSAIAARTTTLRLGTGVVLAPLGHPMRLAEEFATLDVLSGGRVECGLGRGMDAAHFAGYGISVDESAARLEEAVAIVRRAFAGAPFSFDGRFHHIDHALLAPTPVQRPHPPVRLAANSIDTMRLAGRLGLPIIVAAHVNTISGLQAMLPAYREEQAEAGHAATHDDITVLAPTFTAATNEAVRRAVEPGIAFFRDAIVRKVEMSLATMPAGPANDATRARVERLLDGVRALDYETMARDRAVYGTPDECRRQLDTLRRDLGADRTICWFNLGGTMEHRDVVDAMERFVTHVVSGSDALVAGG